MMQKQSGSKRKRGKQAWQYVDSDTWSLFDATCANRSANNTILPAARHPHSLAGVC